MRHSGGCTIPPNTANVHHHALPTSAYCTGRFKLAARPSRACDGISKRHRAHFLFLKCSDGVAWHSRGAIGHEGPWRADMTGAGAGAGPVPAPRLPGSPGTGGRARAADGAISGEQLAGGSWRAGGWEAAEVFVARLGGRAFHVDGLGPKQLIGLPPPLDTAPARRPPPAHTATRRRSSRPGPPPAASSSTPPALVSAAPSASCHPPLEPRAAAADDALHCVAACPRNPHLKRAPEVIYNSPALRASLHGGQRPATTTPPASPQYPPTHKFTLPPANNTNNHDARHRPPTSPSGAPALPQPLHRPLRLPTTLPAWRRCPCDAHHPRPQPRSQLWTFTGYVLAPGLPSRPHTAANPPRNPLPCATIPPLSSLASSALRCCTATPPPPHRRLLPPVAVAPRSHKASCAPASPLDCPARDAQAVAVTALSRRLDTATAQRYAAPASLLHNHLPTTARQRA